MRAVEETIGEKLEGGRISNDLPFACAAESEQTHVPRTRR